MLPMCLMTRHEWRTNTPTFTIWALKVSLWFASLCQLIVHTIGWGEGKFSAAVMSWTGSWQGLRSASLSGRKKYGEAVKQDLLPAVMGW